MFQNQKSPDPKLSKHQGTAHVSPSQNVRHVNSSEGYRQKPDSNKASRSYLLNDQSTDQGPEIRHFSAHSPPKYRITTTIGSLRSAGPKLKNKEHMDDTKVNDPLDSVQNIRGINSAEKDLYRGGPKYMAIEKEKLYEEWLQLKQHVNAVHEENTRLKTRNALLEKEANKFEKMFQEVATNPKMQKKLLKAEEGNVPNLKQHMKDLKNDLEDRKAELIGLKKKAKVTKVNELEVQIQAFQDEIMRLKACADNIIAKKTEKIMQEGERRLVQAQNAECERLTKEIEALKAITKKNELACQDYHNQIASKDEKHKKDHALANQVVQTKEKEIAQLKSQLVSYAAANAKASSSSNKKSSSNTATAADTKNRKELEQKALENHDLKVNIEDKTEHIAELERRLKEAEAKLEAENASKAKEPLVEKAGNIRSEPIQSGTDEELRKAIKNPSYTSQTGPKEGIKQEQRLEQASNPAAQPPKEKEVAQKEEKKGLIQDESTRKKTDNDIPKASQEVASKTGKDNITNTTDAKGNKGQEKNLENLKAPPASNLGAKKEENEEKYNDEFEKEEHKLSDEDEDDENYEYLFPPDEKRPGERITEKGEDEEDEEYKEDENHEKNKEVSDTQLGKQKSEALEEEEYQDEEYEEEPDEEDQTKTKSQQDKRGSQTESLGKSKRNEPAKSENTQNMQSSNRSKNEELSSARQKSRASQQSVEAEKRKLSEPSEKYESEGPQSTKSLEAQDKSKSKQPAAAAEEDYEEEYEAEFPEEDQ